MTTETTDIFITPVASDRAILLNAIPRIFFPWDKLLPDLTRVGKQGFTVEFADLSAFAPPTGEVSPHAEDNHGHGGHVLYADRVPGLPDESARAAWGLFWFDGRIQIEQTLRSQQGNIDWVLSAEIAHAVDVFYMLGRGMRGPINSLLHGGGSDAHPWFGGADYFAQTGEGWMSVFGVAYTDFVQPDARFAHSIQSSQAPTVRTILQAPRTDDIAPPPPGIDWSQVTDAEFDAEFNRRYGFFKDIEISQGFTVSSRRWTGYFTAS